MNICMKYVVYVLASSISRINIVKCIEIICGLY